MKREEGDRLGPPDKTREFIAFPGVSSLRRGSLVVTRRRGEGQGWESQDGSHWTIGGLGLAPLLGISQSSGFGCTSLSVSVRRFASWTALTPPGMGIQCVWPRKPSTRASAFPWRLPTKDDQSWSTPPSVWCDLLGPSGKSNYLGNWLGKGGLVWAKRCGAGGNWEV